VHFEATHFVFYLVLGLAAGWLVRRTRGMGASIALHAANNAFATLLLLV
jgi:membrane protease YdiL (CAAX protease family)